VEDYKTRSYLSAVEAARFLVHELAKEGKLPFSRAASGQMRFRLEDLKKYLRSIGRTKKAGPRLLSENIIELAGTTQRIYLKSIGFIFKRDIVWQKTNSVRAHFGTYPYPGGILINNNHEFILEFEKPAPKGYQKYAHLTREQKEASKLDKAFWIEVKKSDVWVMKPQGSGDRRSHIAPFPYELPYRLIKAYSYVGETVLDPFLGSGTTLLAAADLGRDGVGYEINPEIAEKTYNFIRCSK